MIKRLFVSALMVVAVASAVWAQTQTAVQRHGALRVSGNKILDKNGQPVMLRGMSFFWNNPGWGQAGYYTSGVTNWLADDWKATIVRVAVDPEQTSNTNWQTVVDAAIAKGIYVIIDFHAHSHHLQEQSRQFFMSAAVRKYKNNPQVLYEIFNEPCGKQYSQNGGGGCTGDNDDGVNWKNEVKPYAQAVVTAIRNDGDTNIIIVPTSNFSKRVDLAAADPVSGKNLVYSLHFYTGCVATSSDPTCSNSEHRQRLRNWVNAGLNAGVAVFASEFGLSQPGGGVGNGENNTIDVKEADIWMDFLEQNSIGWANWSVGNKAEAASSLMGDAGTSGNWSTGSTNCNAANGTTPITSCSLHGQLRCSGNYIRNKLRHYATPVTISATASGPGTVNISPTQTQYFPGQTVTLTPVPSSGARFEGWGSGVSNLTANPASITLTGNTAAQAVFVKDNPIKNSTFTANTNSWASNPAGLTIEHVNGEMKVSMPSSPGAAPDAYRLQHASTSLENGRKYRLSFQARAASGSRTIVPAVRGGGISVAWIEGIAVTLTSTMQSFTVDFSQTTATTAAGIVGFNVGGNAGGFIMDNITLEDIGPADPASVNPQVKVVGAVKPFRAVFNGSALLLSGGGSVADVMVFDLTGRMRLSERASLANAGTRVSLDRLPAGVYTVRYKVDGKAFGVSERVILAK